MGTGHGPEVAGPEKTRGLVFQGLEHIGQRGPLHRILVVQAAPSVGHWLVADAQHCWVFQPKTKNVSQFTIVHPLGHSGYQDGI